MHCTPLGHSFMRVGGAYVQLLMAAVLQFSQQAAVHIEQVSPAVVWVYFFLSGKVFYAFA
jgi:hypothetical protein